MMAYLMKYENRTLLEAHDIVKENRKFVRPNRGFWNQLIEYELKLKGSNTVHLFDFGGGKTLFLNIVQISVFTEKSNSLYLLRLKSNFTIKKIGNIVYLCKIEQVFEFYGGISDSFHIEKHFTSYVSN